MSAWWRWNSCSSSAITWYSVTPGRVVRMARMWAPTAICADRRITSASLRLLKRRMSCSWWSSATNSCGLWTPCFACARSVLTQPITRWSKSEVHAHRVVTRVAALEQARQDVVDVADRERIVGAVVAHGAIRSGATAIPGLAGRVAIAHEQDVFAVRASRNQHGHRFRFVETGQVMEIAVGPVVVMDVAVALPLGRGGKDGDGALAHELHQLVAAARVFVFAQGHGNRRRLRLMTEDLRGQWRAVDVVWLARWSASSS